MLGNQLERAKHPNETPGECLLRITDEREPQTFGRNQRLADAIAERADWLRFESSLYDQRHDMPARLWAHVQGLLIHGKRGRVSREEIMETIRLEGAATAPDLDEFELVALVTELRNL